MKCSGAKQDELVWGNMHVTAFSLHKRIHCPLCRLFFSTCVQILVSGFTERLPNHHSVSVRTSDMLLSDTKHTAQTTKTPPTASSFDSIHWDTHEKLLLNSIRLTNQTWCKFQLLKAKAGRFGILWVYGNTSSWAHGSHVAGLPVRPLCFSVELLGFHGGQDVALLSVHFPQKDARPT